MNYEWIPSPNFRAGRSQPLKYIVIHHWDDPARKPSVQGVLSHFKDPAVQVSAHYVVTDARVIQMVKETDTAWHAKQANPFTIGIEIDPRVPGATYKTVGRLVREIRERHGNLPLRKHSDFNTTRCPGSLDLARIDREAKAVVKQSNTSAPQGGTMATTGITAQDLDAIYLYGPLGRKRGAHEGEDVYLGKSVSFVLTDHYNSKEAKEKRVKTTPAPVTPQSDADASKWRQLKKLLLG